MASHKMYPPHEPPTPCRICGAIPEIKSLSIPNMNMGIEFRVYPCGCIEHAERERSEREAWEKLLRKAKIPPKYQAATLEPTGYSPHERMVLPICQEFISQVVQHHCHIYHSLRGIGFIGDVGVGKTYYLCAILLELLRQGKTCVFLSMPQYYTDLKNSFGSESSKYDYEELLSQAQNMEVAAFDDIGAEHTSQWTVNELEKIINYRYNYGLLTLFSSNLRPEELAKRIGARSVDRLKEMCRAISLTGKSLRGKKV